MAAPLLIAKTGKTELCLLPALANRHGLITGATGTGKTVTLQALAQGFSAIGVPVFMADVKGDLSGIAKAGGGNAKVAERAKALKLDIAYAACPVVFWDVFGEGGHPVRATVSDMGPLLLVATARTSTTRRRACSTWCSRSPTTTACCCSTRRTCARCCSTSATTRQKFTTEYGNVSAASIGAIQRGAAGAGKPGRRPLLRRADARTSPT